MTSWFPSVWSNFEIADMEFWRGEAYTAFFDYLEAKGGFYYEVCPSRVAQFPSISPADACQLQQRWGDAPVHSIGAALFARKDQIHFFDDIGYLHYPLQHCPRHESVRTALECVCDPNGSYGEFLSRCVNNGRPALRIVLTRSIRV